jgi:PAS domain S-box-containing protein
MAILELPDKLVNILTNLANEQQITIPALLNQFIDDDAIDKQYFQAYMDKVPLVAYIKDTSLNHLYSNPYLIDAIEQQGGEYQHKTPVNVLPKNISGNLKSSDLKVLETNDIVVLDDYALENGEHTAWYKEVKFPIEGSDGKRYIGGFAIDITKQKQIEEEQQLLLDRSPIPVAITTLDHKTEYYNEVFTKTFGYTLGDIPDDVTWMVNAYPDPEYRGQVIKQWSVDMQQARNTNNLIPARNYTITDKFGEEHIVSIHGSIIGKRLFITFIDITEQQKMQETIAHSEVQYRSLFENAFHPIVLYDADATILMINSVGANNLNDTVENIVGCPLGDFLPDPHENTVKLIRQVMESGETIDFESEILLQGRQIVFWTVIQPIFDKNRKINSIQILSYDITEQRRAEEIQKKQAQLELTLTKERQISDLRTRLLTTISHEFRTPLAIIQTNSEILIRYNDRFTQTQKEKNSISSTHRFII